MLRAVRVIIMRVEMSRGRLGGRAEARAGRMTFAARAAHVRQ